MTSSPLETQKKLPCSECITLASCRATVLKYDMTDAIAVMKAITIISRKCTLVKRFMFKREQSVWGDGETMEYEVIDDHGSQLVILEILGEPCD